MYMCVILTDNVSRPHFFFMYKLGSLCTEHKRYTVVFQTGNSDFNVEI